MPRRRGPGAVQCRTTLDHRLQGDDINDSHLGSSKARAMRHLLKVLEVLPSTIAFYGSKSGRSPLLKKARVKNRSALIARRKALIAEQEALIWEAAATNSVPSNRVIERISETECLVAGIERAAIDANPARQ